MIYHGDCFKILKTLDSNSIDSLVTDPPAGISFMGKSWDSDKGGRDEWINWLTSVMREVHRVLKPGAHGLVWAIPRTSHWTATALENAGFEVRDVVTHLFGSGFPKSLDISKAIDKQAGAEREVIGANPSSRPNSKMKGSKGFDRSLESKESAGLQVITAPSTDSAKQWQGFGTALKPAAEMWILIRKPISEKTIAANVIKWGCGGLNIDASRIDPIGMDPRVGKNISYGNAATKFGQIKSNMICGNLQGRFPANLVFSHTEFCTDDQCDIECAIKMLDEQSGGCVRDNIGGASRFFYCAKVSSKERNAGLSDLNPKESGIKNASGRGYSESDPYKKILNQNNHPTVKALKLMSYLIKLITPPNGTVLDPFMGSGSTGIAAKKEGFKFIGIEKEHEYFEIAEKRIEAHG